MTVNTIALNPQQIAPHYERLASEPLEAGICVAYDSNGKLEVGLGVSPRFVTECGAKVSGGSVDDTYIADELTPYVIPQRGEQVNAKVAAGAGAIAFGENLEVAADGTVQVANTGKVIGTALEAVDNSGGSETKFIKIEVA